MSSSYASLASKKEEARNDFLPKLTLTQKIRVVSGGSMWTLKPIKSLNLPKIWLSDGPHGLRKQHDEWVTDLLNGRVEATCFPTASCLACSWDPPLLERMGQALGRECRAHGVSVLLGPGVNCIRHPLGGRNFEYYSEDPYLTGQMAASLVQGVQSLGIGVSLKHFLCNNQETWRFVLDVIVDERTQREIYEAAFEHVVKEAQPWTVMCAYNKVNGCYGGENPLFNNRLRNDWDFKGLVMTDWGATNNRVAAIAAGVDLEMPGSVGACDRDVMDAIESGELSEDDLDDCVVNVLSLMLLGKEQLEASKQNQQLENGDVVNLDAHHDLAREIALKSIVLLKNDANILPLQLNASVAVIGGFAKEPRFQGMGSSEVNANKIDCAWDRIQEYTKNATYAKGYHRHYKVSQDVNEFIAEAVEVAKQADVVLLFCGLVEISESEAFDRPDAELTPGHNALVEAIAKANPNTVVVLSNGSGVTMPWVSNVNGILESWLCGESGASATVDLLFGKASPSGKLAQTFPVSLEDEPNANCFPGANRQVQYREGLNVGYRYYNSAKKDTLFPFGHGLSYSKFEFSNLSVKVASSSPENVEVSVSVDVANVGEMEAGEVMQCYIHDVESSVYRPHHELKGFEKVYLKPQEKVTILLTLDKRAFSFWDIGAQEWIVEAGEFEVLIGTSSRDILLRQTVALTSPDVSSAQAQLSHPPVAMPLLHIRNSDVAFKAMLGKDIPLAKLPLKLEYNSLLGDTQHTLIGRMIKGMGVSMMLAHAKIPSIEEIKFSNALLHNTPMRSLVLFSRGDMDFVVLDVILHIMNRELLTAIWKFPWMIFIVIYHKCFTRKNKV